MTIIIGIKDISEIVHIASKHLNLLFLPDFERTVILNTLQESNDEDGLLYSFIHLLEFFSYDEVVSFYQELFEGETVSLVLYRWKNDLY